MKSKIIVLVLALLVSSCRKENVRTDSNEADQFVSSEFRGAWLTDDFSITNQSELKTIISATLDNIASLNYNTVFLDAEALYSSAFENKNKNKNLEFNTLHYSIDEAHKHGLKIYACIDLSKHLDQEKPLAEIKTEFKKLIKQFVENYNIDGLHFSNIYSLCNENLTEKQFTDLIEDLFVEAMLIKPYLVNSVPLSSSAEIYEEVFTWLDEGIIDFIVPTVDLNSQPTIIDFWLTLKEKTVNSKSIFPLIKSINLEMLNILKMQGCEGIVIKDYSKFSFKQKTICPENLKKVQPEQIVQLNVSTLLNSDKGGQEISISEVEKINYTDSKGCVGFILKNIPDTLIIKSKTKQIHLPTQWWRTPYNYRVTEGNSVERVKPWVEFRKIPNSKTYRSSFPFLAKTDSSAKAWINNVPAKVYGTGIFFNDVEFIEGVNRVEAKVIGPDSITAIYVREFIYKHEDKTVPTYPLWIDEKSVEPNKNLTLLDDDVVRVKFVGSKEQDGKVEVIDTDLSFLCERTDYKNYSTYETEIPLRMLEKHFKHQLNLVLETKDESVDDDTIELKPLSTIEVKYIDEFPLIKTVKNNSRLTYTLGEVRLGGPLRAEYPPGVVLTTSGIIGDNYRVKLNKIDNGYIDKSYVEELSNETLKPKYNISSLYCTPTDSGDVLRIPYLESVPYSIVPEPHLKRIVINLYGVETSSTWITHKTGRKIINRVTWEQVTPETYSIYVNLNSSKIWGYDIKKVGKSLVFRVKYPPLFNLKNASPLTGLKIAIEAGHGGTNLGAIGLSGLKEKDINFDLSQKLGEVFKNQGAEVIQVRDSDRNMYLSEKRDISIDSNADMHISIHANSAGSRRGYLGVSGTSMFYHNPFWAPLAEMIHNNVLKMNISEFGVVGSFNYTVTRMTEMPSMLVEQAFMSNAEDEEKLANEEFRMKMAENIYKGVLEYLEYMNDK